MDRMGLEDDSRETDHGFDPVKKRQVGGQTVPRAMRCATATKQPRRLVARTREESERETKTGAGSQEYRRRDFNKFAKGIGVRDGLEKLLNRFY